ncbi:MAG: MBL fold metallo-hydrolase [Lachnospiraceae bacterium]|nr:MBL fold metallo-hydrolase [Lachnospiraceae bacterium]
MDKCFGQGDVSLRWLGQMGFIVEAGETRLCIDYYATPDESRQIPPLIPAEELKDVDVFLGTHDHLDHIDHAAWKIWAKTNPNAKFVFPAAHMDSVIADGVNEHNAVGLNDGESVTIGDVTIHTIAASHEFLDRDPVTGLYPYLQYIIETDGVRIHHAGDTVRYEGMMPKLRAFGKIDAEILPINGRDAQRYRNNCIGNMTYQEAADLAGEVEPGIVIPGHWDMFADNSADPYAFADYIDAKYTGKFKCVIPQYDDRIIIQRQL